MIIGRLNNIPHSYIMSILSRKIHFGGSRRISHPFSIHRDSFGRGTEDQDECCQLFPTKSNSRFETENSPLWSVVMNILPFGGLLFAIMALGGIGFGVEYIVGLMNFLYGVQCTGHAFFILPQFGRFHIAKYLLPSLLCLWLSCILFLTNIKPAPSEFFRISWPWHIVSIPLYLVPIAFAIGIASFYCVVLRPPKSYETHEDSKY